MREPFLENPDLAHPAPIDSEQDIVLHARPGPEGGDEIQAYGALVDGRVEREAPLLGRLVAPASLLEGVRNARRTGSLSARNSSDPRDQLWRSIAQHAPADSSSDLGATLEATLTSTLPPNGPRRRVILNADPSTLLAALPLEGVAIDDSRVFETSRAELLRFVHVEDAPRPIPRAPYLRRHRALVLVGDIEQSSRVTGSTRDLRREVQAVVQALRGAGTEVVVGSVTGRLELTGAVQRPLLLDDRGDDAEREERCRSALREMLSEVPVDVLHYVGHGDEAAESQVGRASTSVSFSLPMRERDRGRSRRIWIEGAELNRWTRRPLRLCTLSACAASPQLAAALCAAAEHVVVMTSRVSPEFTAAWTRALYGRLFDADEPRAIGVAVAEARDALRSIGHDEHAWIPQHYARSLDDAPFSGTRYRALLDRHVSELGVMEGALSAWWQPVDEAWLDRVYVEADIEGAAVPEVPPPEEGLIQDDLPSASWTLDRLARTTPHVLGLERAHFRLVGAAGSGKTTALRIVARRLTRLGERLPIYIRLPQWERHGFGLEFLEEQGLGRDLLEQRAPDLVLLLDGLDEIREHDAFRSLLRKSWFPFDEAALVVAGRATAGSIGDGFQRIDLARLSQARAVELATRVLNIERGQAERDLDGERGTRRADEARKRLARIADHAESAERVVDHLSVHLRHEARVPLFVTMAARLWARGLDITTIGRMKFYEQVLDMLVESGHRETDVTGRPTTALRRAARCLALESLVDVDAMDGFRRGRFGATIETSTLAKQCVPRSSLEDVGEWECTRVRAALLDTGLLAGDARGELEWTHPSFRDALVAEAFIELVQRLGIDEALSVARRVVVDADGPPSALAEALGLAAMGLGRDDDRERWIQHLLDVERATGSEARLASRVLFQGVTVSQELAGEILGITGDWRQRHDLYEQLDEHAPDELVAQLGAMVQHAHDVDAKGQERIRRRDLGYAWERAAVLESDPLAQESVPRLRDLVLGRLPAPDRASLCSAFETIGSTWAPGADDLEVLQRSRTSDALSSIHVATPETPFWVDVDGTREGSAFEWGADRDDVDAFSDEGSSGQRLRFPRYAISSVPVTRGLYRIFDPHHGPNASGRADEPATHVTWYEARLFAAWATHWLRRYGALGEDERIDLPTEIQWEFAARERGDSAGGSRFHTGRAEVDLAIAGWYRYSNYGPEGRRVMPVGLLAPAHVPSGRGRSPGWIWDCHGNVWEWCRDVYSERPAYGREGGSATWLSGRGAFRVLRGGSFLVNARRCRASYRGGDLPALDDAPFVDGGGFRLVRNANDWAAIVDEGSPERVEQGVRSPAASRRGEDSDGVDRSASARGWVDPPLPGVAAAVVR